MVLLSDISSTPIGMFLYIDLPEGISYYTSGARLYERI